MLTEEFLKEHFVDAYFIDNERTTIEVQTKTEDKKSIFTTIIPFDLNNLQYQALNKTISLDELHEATYNHHKKESEAFKQEVMRIAKEDGLIFEEQKGNTDYFPKLVKAIIEDDKNEDDLFALKLALFEVEKIRDSENAELKANIRKGETKVETLLNALKIIIEK